MLFKAISCRNQNCDLPKTVEGRIVLISAKLMENPTPHVLLIAFNRPSEARRVFEQIKLARPSKLYIACDGPRSTKTGEAELVEKVRSLATEVDWPCEVKTRFLAENLGCGRAVSSAIEWFLNDAGEGIILEDDCLPTPAFFRFCATMLDRYRDDERVGVIAGTNLAAHISINQGYAFSRILSCWGWATWGRSWHNYYLQPHSIDFSESWTRHLPAKSVGNLKKAIDDIGRGNIHTWDYQFMLHLLRRDLLTIIPSENLILNIGFDGDGSHFNRSGRPWWVPDFAIDTASTWVLENKVIVHKKYDAYFAAVAHDGVSKHHRSWIKICSRIRSFLRR